MPTVIVNWIEGRSDEHKRKLVDGIAKSFDAINIDGGKVHIIINDVPKNNWGHNRVPATDWNHLNKTNTKELINNCKGED